MPESSESKQMTFRLSPEAQRLLKELSQQLGVPMTSIIELAIREKAQREKIR
jgi:predicted DNA-binding protein